MSNAKSVVAGRSVDFKAQLLCAAAFGLVGVPAFGAVTYSPIQIRNAYGVNALPGNVTGAGQTISIIDFGNDTTVGSDLAKFDTDFGIATTGSLTVVNENGGSSLPATTDSEGLTETSLDVQYVHAIAPAANIVLIETPNAPTYNDIITAANTGASRGAIVSMSFGNSGGINETGTTAATYDAAFNHAGVTFVASAGDSGDLNYPASSPYVIGVGGTNLQITGGTNNGTLQGAGGTYAGETVWNSYVPKSGSTAASGGSTGGGTDTGEPIPTYQVGVATGPYRNTPDVAYDADPNSGVDVVIDGGADGGVGGTSAGAPQWAALIALADQLRASEGLSTLSSTQALTMLYASYSDKSLYAELFHDVTTGSNQNGLSAGVGYDEVTGLGTPIANNVVDYLADIPIVVPEPASLAIIAAGGLLLTRRRKLA